MEAKAKLLGHPIHQMLIVFPLGLLSTSLAFDIAYLAGGNPVFASVSFWMITAGVLGGLLAAGFGLIDWLWIPAGTRAKSIGFWHGISNVMVVVLFAVSWWLRTGSPGSAPSTTAVILSCVAIALASIAGWLGGELVVRLGVGVDAGAGVNAPSSLTGRSASLDDVSRRRAA